MNAKKSKSCSTGKVLIIVQKE
jgi:hypothetical protein